ncbi:MAG: TraB/GumN family protein, partial [Acaryochloridaceae cyanobacterium RL_2_7]|nr:TraB/GumN family protein [Acaryochloridaceae cyanobacterium RL_2_7]
QINGLLNSVMNGDIKDIEAQVKVSCIPDPNLCHEMLDKRNILWMNQIRTYLQDDEDYFIIVGGCTYGRPKQLNYFA